MSCSAAVDVELAGRVVVALAALLLASPPLAETMPTVPRTANAAAAQTAVVRLVRCIAM